MHGISVPLPPLLSAHTAEERVPKTKNRHHQMPSALMVSHKLQSICRLYTLAAAFFVSHSHLHKFTFLWEACLKWFRVLKHCEKLCIITDHCECSSLLHERLCFSVSLSFPSILLAATRRFSFTLSCARPNRVAFDLGLGVWQV